MVNAIQAMHVRIVCVCAATAELYSYLTEWDFRLRRTFVL